jgi:hypothetical protein
MKNAELEKELNDMKLKCAELEKKVLQLSGRDFSSS